MLLTLSVAQKAHAQENTFYQLWKDQSTSISKYQGNSPIISNGIAKYTSHLGYTISYPATWELDNHNDENYVRLFGSNFRINITVDSLLYRTYASYKNDTLQYLSNNIQSTSQFTTSKGYAVDQVTYSRPVISSLSNDLNMYVYYFVKNGNQLITLQLKTDQANLVNKMNDTKVLLNNLIFENATSFSNAQIAQTPVSVSYQGTKKDLTIPTDKVVYGMFEYPARNITNVESDLNAHFGSQMIYEHIDSPYDSTVNWLIQQGKTPVITFQIGSYKTTSDPNGVEEVINGDFDTAIQNWAKGIKETGTPVFIRIGNEMNGYWVSWGYKGTYEDSDLYAMAYRHIVDIFKANGADNAKFVWNPNGTSIPDYGWNAATMYYPGQNYVDWLGMTRYNFGTPNFSYFDDLYKDLYQEYSLQFPNKPMMIGEFGSVESNGNKPYFIKDMFQKISHNYPNLKLIIWFDSGDGVYPFQYNTTPESKIVFKEGLQGSNIATYPLTDHLPSGLNLETPSNSTVSNTYWNFRGTVNDSTVQSVYIDGNLLNSQQFDIAYTLKDGANFIDVKIERTDSTVENYTYVINKSPSFKITLQGSDPSHAYETNNSNFTLTGVISDNSISTMKVNGINTTTRYAWKQFDAPVSLKNGLNVIKIQGFDANNSIISTEKYYVLKKGDVKITSPNTNFINSSKITVSGFVSSENVKQVFVNGIPQILKWSWRQFDQPINLTYGNNTIQVDSLYQGSDDQNIILDPQRENITIHTPSIKWNNQVGYTPSQAGLFYNKDGYLYGTVKDSSVSSIKINGKLVPLTIWKQFYVNVPLHAGLNAIPISGYDDLGKLVMQENVFLYKLTTSDFRILSPANGAGIRTNYATFTGTVPNKKITSVKINGITQTIKGTSRQFKQKVSLNRIGTFHIPFTLYIKDSYKGTSFNLTYQGKSDRSHVVL